MSRVHITLLGALLLTGCVSTQPGVSNLGAVLWFQTSAEYRGNSITVYAAATDRLAALKARPGVAADLDQASAVGCRAGTRCDALAAQALVSAVVLDVDETVLDNSPYQARLVKTGGSFDPATWDNWIAERSAAAVPGAAAFIVAASQAGFAVVYITNRRCQPRPGNPDRCPQMEDTRANLVSAGIPPLGGRDLLVLRNQKAEWDQSEKKARRAHVAESYRIAMLIGDDIGDLASDIKSASLDEREAFVERHAALYGRYWFQLTNPIYGSWSRAIPEPRAASLDTRD